ncbi:IS1634 family transposase [Schaalia canis]|uniref:IS1634 family transposase n=1 Tax=Schaalia canis TaxID=100469 RepID=A0A3P1SF04_9ACTO|nr:IS1634 family transposase [Schaalia canis]
MQIVEKQGRKNVVLKHVGSARNEVELAALMQAAHDEFHPGQTVLDFEPERRYATSVLRVGGKRSALLWSVLNKAYADVGFDVLGDEAFKQMVLARLIEPCSKEATIGVLERLGVEHVSCRRLFNSLKRCAQRSYRDRLAQACFAHASTHGDLSLVLYDVTTLYFEAEREDESWDANGAFRRIGYSKERRVDPQIIVGLLVDRAGNPLEVEAFEGNKAETHTLIPIIERFQDRHGVHDFVVVADAGMLSVGNLRALDAAGLFFIVGARQSRAPHDLEQYWNQHGDYMQDGQIIGQVIPNPNRKTYESSLEQVSSAQMGQESWRALWQYSAKRAARDNKTLTAQQRRAIDAIEGARPARRPRFVSQRRKGLAFDQAGVDRAQRLVGLKGYITNIPAHISAGSEIIGHYHELWHVEQSFRMSKHDLKARPIFHHTKDAIQAHLTVVTAALAISRYLQAATGHSIKRIVQTLKRHQDITITLPNGQTLQAATPLSPQTQEILTALGH